MAKLACYSRYLLTSYFCIHKRDFNEPGYYDIVVSHPEPNILESEVKCALGSAAVHKASGCNGIPDNYSKP